MKHNATQPTRSHDILVCPSSARNSSTDQTNTTGLDNNVPHIKEPDKRENVWHKRTPVRARANPNHISTQHMTYASHTAQSVPLHNRCQFPSADTDHRCPSTYQQRHKDLCPNNCRSRRNASIFRDGRPQQGLVNTGKVTNRGAVDHRNKGVPSTWRPFSQETIAATLPTQYDNCILFKPRIQNPRT